MKSQIDEEVSQLEKLIASVNLGNTEEGRPIKKLHIADNLDMVDENITEAKISTTEIVHLVQSSDHMGIEGLVASNDEHFDPDEEPNATTDKNDMKCKAIHLVEARVSAKKLLDFMSISPKPPPLSAS